MVKVINNYTLIQKIGEGTYGEVYRAINTNKMGQFAVKIIPVEKFIANIVLEQCVVNEIKTLSTIGPSEFIVKYEDHFQTRNNYYFVYQYCNGGTLLDLLKQSGPLTEIQALAIFKQLLEAFKVLNRHNIMHRDIKPENIFFTNNKVKLGDFGFCKGLKPGQHMAKTMLGSPIYMAPEVLKGQNYTMKADIWSLGVVLYEMLFGVCPFQSNSIAMLINTVNNTEISMPLDSLPISQKTQLLLKKLLTKDYFRRISWVQLFAFKLEDGTSITENDTTQKSPFNTSNKSPSIIKPQITAKGVERSYETNKKPSNSSKEKMKFYSEKYMNFVTQPIVNSIINSTERKISAFGQNQMCETNVKDESRRCYQIRQSHDRAFEQLFLLQKEQDKRSRLLAKHCQCLSFLKQSLTILQQKSHRSLGESYISLIKVHHKLQEITEEIKVSETNLLDVASLINYEIIQVDRQLIETKQEILRRKMTLPRQQKLKQLKLGTSKSVQEQNSPHAIKETFSICYTAQQN